MRYFPDTFLKFNSDILMTLEYQYLSRFIEKCLFRVSCCRFSISHNLLSVLGSVLSLLTLVLSMFFMLMHCLIVLFKLFSNILANCVCCYAYQQQLAVTKTSIKSFLYSSLQRLTHTDSRLIGSASYNYKLLVQVG